MTVDLVIEAAFTVSADMPTLNIQTVRVMKKNFPKRGEMEEYQEDFGLCQC